MALPGRKATVEMRSRVRLITLIATLLCQMAGAQPESIEPVTLQLKWHHQFQFAGYYIAHELGFYRENGLDVTIVPGSPTTDVTKVVVSGRADFGVGTSGLLLDFADGDPVVVLGVIYQHSPLVLLMRSDSITDTVHDLVGSSVMIESHSADLLAMFNRAGLDVSTLNIKDHTGRPEDLFTNSARAISAYLTDEPYELDNKGFQYVMLSPRTYGIDFYGDNFFTHRDLIETRRDLADAFRDATVRGWQAALAEPERVVDLIIAKYSQRKTREHLLFEARTTAALMTPLVTPGHMLTGRWAHIADTFVEVGMLSEQPDIDAFMYAIGPSPLPRWVWRGLTWGGAALALLLALVLYLRSFNQRLQREVARRRKTESDLIETNRSLEKALAEVHTLKGLLPVCSHCKSMRSEDGTWESMEAYISKHSDADLSHSICPKCSRKYYGRYFEDAPDSASP